MRRELSPTLGRAARALGTRPLDVAAAVAFTAFLLLATSHIPRGDGGRPVDAFGYLLLVVAGGSMAVSRGRPRTVLGNLHDSVAHAMTTINVQAGGAAHVLDRRPEAAKDALTAIQRASGDVLDELAAMLSLLRDDDEIADRAPTPGIGQITHLVEATRGAGPRASLVVDGPTEAIPENVGTAAYRIVQESLTNVIRHAGATTAAVTVRARADRGLTVEVRDDGAGPHTGSAGTGIGIRGMRERAESTGGRLDAGAEPGGGFTVRASWDGRS